MNFLDNIASHQISKKTFFHEFTENFEQKKPKIMIVGLCGGQGGGKTKLSKILCKNIPNSAIIEERSYFKTITSKRKLSYDIEPLFDEVGGYSKDRKLFVVELSNPQSYDYEKFYQDLKSLKEGKPASIRIFKEDLGAYTGDECVIDPNEISLVILEGYFLFGDKNVRDLIDLKIYVEIDDDIRLSRLLVNENKFLKNNSVAVMNFFMIYKNYIKPSYEQYIAPTKQRAQLILLNYTIRDDEVIDGDETFESLIVMLKSFVKQRTTQEKVNTKSNK